MGEYKESRSYVDKDRVSLKLKQKNIRRDDLWITSTRDRMQQNLNRTVGIRNKKYARLSENDH